MMTIIELRNKLHPLGYSLRYTFGINQYANVSTWKPGVPLFSKTVDMSDPIFGRRELIRIYEELSHENLQ